MATLLDAGIEKNKGEQLEQAVAKVNPSPFPEGSTRHLQEVVLVQQAEINNLKSEVQKLKGSLKNLVEVLRPQIRGIMDRFNI